jgi:HlyD family secretion protein
VGGVIRAGERVLDVVPQDQELIIEARVRPEDADSLVPGQETEVRITAFSGRDMPIVHGELRTVSADRFTDDRDGQGYFLIQVAVPPEELTLITDQAVSARRLRAGLPAEVIVPTRKRTALQYLLEPLDQSLWRSLREE